MKIIEGKLAGKTINYKEQKGTRVTSEKVRKAVFDVLKNLVDFKNLKVADLFCGSGMYGLESLSRGAASIIFVDESRENTQKLKRNLEEIKKKLKILDIGYCGIKIVNKKFETFIKSCDEKFDLVFADPPYYPRQYGGTSNFDFQEFDNIYKILNKDGVFVLEGSKRVRIGELKELELFVEKKYGDTKVLFFRKAKK